MGAADRAHRGTGFVAREVGQAFAVCFEQGTQFGDQVDALFDIGGPVGRVEGAAGGGDGFIHIGGRSIGGLADRLAGPGADDIEGLAALRVAQHAVDVEFGVGESGHG